MVYLLNPWWIPKLVKYFNTWYSRLLSFFKQFIKSTKQNFSCVFRLIHKIFRLYQILLGFKVVELICRNRERISSIFHACFLFFLTFTCTMLTLLLTEEKARLDTLIELMDSRSFQHDDKKIDILIQKKIEISNLGVK